MPCTAIAVGLLVQLSASGKAQSITSAHVYHAPQINGGGRVEGSLQQMLGEAANLNGGATITGDWLVPGTPTVTLNGNPVFGGTIAGTGSTAPSGWSIILNGNAQLGKLRTRTTPVALPVIATVQTTTGTQNITINQPNQTVANWTVVRDLTLQGNHPSVAMPPGRYGKVAISSQGTLTLGIAGSSSPALYQLQSLTFNGQAKLELAGPVTLRLQNGVSLNGNCGVGLHPDWLTLELKTGGLTLNGGSNFWGKVIAPSGTVTINGNAGLTGNSISDRLIINGSGLLKIQGGSSGGNQPPVATALAVTTPEETPAGILLGGTDPESAPLTYSVLTPPAHGVLTGTAPALTYTPATDYTGADSFTYKVNDGQSDSAPATVSLTVTPVNDVPTATPQTLTGVEDTPRAITLTGTDVDLTPLSFSVTLPPSHGTLSGTAPNLTYFPAPNYSGPDSFSFTANDGGLTSPPATVSLNITPVNDAPAVSATSFTVVEDSAKTLTLTASDADGGPLAWQVLTSPLHGTRSG